MKLSKVEAFPLRVKMDDKLRAGTFSYEDYQTVVVRVDVEGEVGWGEVMTRFSPTASALMAGWVGSRMEKTEFASPAEAWNSVWQQLRVRGHTRGMAVEALSGVEMALWDAAGKLARKPLAKMLSAKTKARVQAYGGSVFESRGPLAKQVAKVKAAELRGFKLKAGFGVEKDVELTRKARRSWADGMLVVDAGCAYTPEEAVKLMGGLSPLEPAWLEEPLVSDDFDGYAEIAKVRKVRVGAGETWFVDDLRGMIDPEVIDVLEPSVSRCGGVGVEFSAAEAARRRGVRFAPMVGANSGLSLAASLHVAAAAEGMAVEYDPFGNPLVEELVVGLGTPAKGELKVPSKPGLGVEVDERFIRAHSGRA